jgi:hypothetical protein
MRAVRRLCVTRSLIPVVLVTALAATALNSLVILAHYYAVSANGSDILLWYTVLLVFPLLIALVAVVMSLPFFLFRSKRKEATYVFVAAVVYLAIGILCISIGSVVRIRGFERLAAYPKYEYVTGDRALENYDGNPWAVWVDTPSGGINWDIFLYYPRQNYPQRGHGGSLERVRDRAYVHE